MADEAPELPSIRISLDLEPHLPIVAGEATYVEQILRNLLGNAAKYTPAGHARRGERRVEPDGVAFRVTDAGPGLSEAALDRIFELFYRDPERARRRRRVGYRALRLRQPGAGHGRSHLGRADRSGGGSEFGFLLRVIEADDELPEAGRAEGNDPTMRVP